MYLTAKFRVNEARNGITRALSELTDKSFTSEDVDIYSNEPLELPPGVLPRRSHMSFAVVTGAITFSLLIIGFVFFTQHNYPLITGGMPLFSFWATGVVFYEITMLGAILTTVFWFLHESRLFRRNRPPAPEVEPGWVCLQVRCRPDQAAAARESLAGAGAENISQSGDHA